MAAISTPGRGGGAWWWVCVIFAPPISPMCVVIWSAGAHSRDPSSLWNLPLSASSVLVSRPAATTTFRCHRRVSARKEGNGGRGELPRPICPGTQKERHRARCNRRELSPVCCQDARGRQGALFPGGEFRPPHRSAPPALQQQ